MGHTVIGPAFVSAYAENAGHLLRFKTGKCDRLPGWESARNRFWCGSADLL